MNQRHQRYKRACVEPTKFDAKFIGLLWRIHIGSTPDGCQYLKERPTYPAQHSYSRREQSLFSPLFPQPKNGPPDENFFFRGRCVGSSGPLS